MLNTSVWFKYELADCDHVVTFKCAVCSQFKVKLESMRNYHSAFIGSTSNVHTSTFKEHAITDIHVRAMALFKKQQSSSVFQYAPIGRLSPICQWKRGQRLERSASLRSLTQYIAKEKLAKWNLCAS